MLQAPKTTVLGVWMQLVFKRLYERPVKQCGCLVQGEKFKEDYSRGRGAVSLWGTRGGEGASQTTSYQLFIYLTDIEVL